MTSAPAPKGPSRDHEMEDLLLRLEHYARLPDPDAVRLTVLVRAQAQELEAARHFGTDAETEAQMQAAHAADLRTQLATVKADLADLLPERDAFQAQNAQLRRDFATANDRIDDLQRAYEMARLRRENAELALASVHDQQNEIADLDATIVDLGTQLATARQELEAAQTLAAAVAEGAADWEDRAKDAERVALAAKRQRVGLIETYEAAGGNNLTNYGWGALRALNKVLGLDSEDVTRDAAPNTHAKEQGDE